MPLPSLVMRCPRLVDLPSLPFLPPGYAVRTLTPSDICAVAALLGRAFPELFWTQEKAHNALITDKNVPTTYLVENPARQIAATASVQFSDPLENTPHVGFLHWVGAEPTETGKGLGYFVSLLVLRELRALGRTEAHLKTEDFRLPALKTYLKLGFRPHLTDETHPARWDAIALKMQMPPYAAWIGERS